MFFSLFCLFSLEAKEYCFYTSDDSSVCPDGSEQVKLDQTKEIHLDESQTDFKVHLFSTNQDIYPTITANTITNLEIIGQNIENSYVELKYENSIENLKISSTHFSSPNEVTATTVEVTASNITVAIKGQKVSVDISTLEDSIENLFNSYSEISIDLGFDTVRVAFLENYYTFTLFNSKEVKFSPLTESTVSLLVNPKSTLFEMFHVVARTEKLPVLPSITFKNQSEDYEFCAIIFDNTEITATQLVSADAAKLKITGTDLKVYSDLDDQKLPDYCDENLQVIQRTPGKYCFTSSNTTDVCESDEFEIITDNRFYIVSQFRLFGDAESTIHINLLSIYHDAYLESAFIDSFNVEIISPSEGDHHLHQITITGKPVLKSFKICDCYINFEDIEITCDSLYVDSCYIINGEITALQTVTLKNSDDFVKHVQLQNSEKSTYSLEGTYSTLLFNETELDIRNSNGLVLIPKYSGEIVLKVSTDNEDVTLTPEDTLTKIDYDLEVTCTKENGIVYFTQEWEQQEFDRPNKLILTSTVDNLTVSSDYDSLPTKIWDIQKGNQITKDINSFCVYPTFLPSSVCRATKGTPISFTQDELLSITPKTADLTLVVESESSEINPLINADNFKHLSSLTILQDSILTLKATSNVDITSIKIYNSTLTVEGSISTDSFIVNDVSSITGSVISKNVTIPSNSVKSCNDLLTETARIDLTGATNLSFNGNKIDVEGGSLKAANSTVIVDGQSELQLSLASATSVFPVIEILKDTTITFLDTCYGEFMSKSTGKLVITSSASHVKIQGNAKEAPTFAQIPEESNNVEYNFYGSTDPSNSPSNDPSNNNNNNSSLLITITLCAIAFVALVAIFGFCLVRRAKQEHKSSNLLAEEDRGILAPIL